MLVLSLTVVVLITLVVLARIARKKYLTTENYKQSDLHSSRMVNYWLCFLVVFTILVCEIIKLPFPIVEQKRIIEYDNINEFIYCFGVDGVEEKILEINDRIDKSRIYKDNIWIGIWYTEKYANLEELPCVE